jgi:mycoredoxin
VSSGATDAPLTIYSTVWCGYCRRLKSQMEREGISFVEVDIEDVPDAADLVMSVNGGMQTVPTLVFADGTALTNPSIAQVRAQLAA